MSTHPTHAKAPTAPTVEAQKARIQLDMSLPRPTRLVNRLATLIRSLSPITLYRELQAARSLVNAYEATAARRARQRQLVRNGAGRKAGRNV